MNSFKIWLSENKLAASLAAAFLLCAGVVGWMTFTAWDGYATASQDYAEAVSKLTKLNQQNPFPSEANRTQFQSLLVRQQSEIDSLLKSLEAYRIPAFHDLEKAKPQDRPQLFQDALRSQVTAVKTVASSKGATVPLGFYLGLEEYENRPPTPEEAVGLSKQLTALNWIAEKLVSHPGVILGEFSRVLPAPAVKTGEPPKKPSLPSNDKTKAAYEALGCMKTTFRCDPSSLRELLNDISAAPYFFVVETIQVQNSVAEPPRRNSPTQPSSPVPATTDGQQPAPRLPIIVGRELLNVSLKIRILEFNTPQPQQQSQQPQRATK
jgi:hypothetical protein